MRPFSILMVLLLAVATLAIPGCSDDDDPEEVVQFDITIVNNTPEDYQIWVDADVDAEGFVQVGTVADATTHTLRDQVIDVSYHIRLLLAGQDAETEFEHERTIRQTDADDVTWTVNP